ncbi:hypothetical protein ACIQF5_20740 [Streptomyces goshikiensis]|uniref:hypothetical protein n=1 Tax=Streptomyces goshikiensis TaxID=1942 RepID=UPI003801070F
MKAADLMAVVRGGATEHERTLAYQRVRRLFGTSVRVPQVAELAIARLVRSVLMKESFDAAGGMGTLYSGPALMALGGIGGQEGERVVDLDAPLRGRDPVALDHPPATAPSRGQLLSGVAGPRHATRSLTVA